MSHFTFFPSLSTFPFPLSFLVLRLAVFYHFPSFLFSISTCTQLRWMCCIWSATCSPSHWMGWLGMWMSDLAGWLPACLTAACSECVCVCACVSASLGAPVMTHIVTGGMLGVETGRGGAVDSLSSLFLLHLDLPRQCSHTPFFHRGITLLVDTVRCSWAVQYIMCTCVYACYSKDITSLPSSLKRWKNHWF